MNRSGNIFPIAETEIEYCTETEEKIINFFLNGEFNEALLLLSDIVEANVGEQFSPYTVLELRFYFASLLVRLLECLRVFESGINCDLPSLDFEIYGKSGKELKEELLALFNVLENEPLISAIGKYSLLFKINAYIDENIASDISLADIAESLELSLSYTSRLFPKITGVKFKTYLNVRRVELAKQKLKRGEVIGDVMNSLGFYNRETFNRVFRRYAGVSPGHYITQTNKETRNEYAT